MRAFIDRPIAYLVAPVLALAGGLAFGSVVTGILVLVTASVALITLRAGLAATGAGRIAWLVVAALAAAGAVIQFVPYGRDHTNPPVTAEPAWDTPETRALAVRACFDCHSNETAWPWYTDLAPVSWVATNHVVAGRGVLNFSTWDRGHGELQEMAGTIREGEMPPAYYRILHSTARLSDAEKQQLIDGLQATITASPPG